MNTAARQSEKFTTQSANPFVFVGGCPRSGTTLLQRMLDHHVQLAVANDAHFIPRVLEIHAPQWIEAAQQGTSIPLSDQLVDGTAKYHRFYRMGLELADLDRAAEAASTYQGFVSNLFTIYARRRGKPLAGEKTPDYVRQMPLLSAMFPESKFIHIVRDGRDTALSLLNWATPQKGPGRFAHWDSDPIAVAALWWRQFVECDAEAKGFAERYYLVRYEDIIHDAADSLEKICAFLDLPFDAAMLRFHEGKQASGQASSAKGQWLPPTKGLRNWRDQMSDEDQAVFDCLAGDALQRLGYPPTTSLPNKNALLRAEKAAEWWSTPGNKRRTATADKITKTTKERRRAEHGANADQRLVARDRQLDNLATLLDQAQFRQWVALHAEQLQVSSDMQLRGDYVRYKPGTNCLVRYVDQHGNPWGYAVAYGDDSDEKLVKKSHVSDDSSIPSQYSLIDRDRRIALFRFPVDADLPQLAQFFDGSLMEDPKAQARLPIVSSAPDWRVLSYKPQRRCVIQILQGNDPLATLRLYREDDFDAAKIIAKHLTSKPWYRAERMAALSGHRAIALRWVAGQTLNQVDELSAALDSTQLAGRLLSDVHRSPHPKLSLLTMDKLISQCDESVQLAKHLAPDYADRMDGLAGRVYSQLASVVPRIAFCHGDLHVGQIIVQPQGVQFLDWDAACNAPIGLDFASFAAHGILASLSSGVSTDRAFESIAALCTGYDQSVVGDPGRGLPGNLDAYIAFGLLRMLPTPFRMRHQDWDRVMDEMLSEVEARSNQAERWNRKSISVPSGLTSNSALLIASTPLTADPEPWFAEALEETRVESQLQPIVASRLPSDRKLALRQIKTIHHKPRQRCVIAYDFRVIDESGIQTNCRVLGKARRKPMKLSAYDIQLRISALTANHSKTPLRVAQPLGIVSSWNLWLQEYLEGQRADELIAPGEYLIVSARIGEALGHLHSLALTTDSVHSFDDELAILRHSLQAVQILDIERIENLIGDCQRLLKSIPVTCLTGIHRDFYPAQVIYKDNEPVGIVDFDLFSWGAAAIDVGNFVAHLKETALRSFGSHSALEDHETEFVNAYLRVNPDVSRESIDVLTVVSLARHVAISQRIPQREVWTQPILSLCEQLMEQVAVRWQTGSEGVRLDPPRAALSGVSSISRFEPNN